MILACMYAQDKTAWECDMAETYGILDWESVPVRKLATLSAGLRHDSRSVMALSGERISLQESLLAMMADRLTWLCWAKTVDGRKGRNKPESILELLLGKTEKDSEVMSFSTSEEFEAERNRILSQIKEE